MKINIFLLAMLAGLVTWILPVTEAQDTDADTEKVSKKASKKKKATKGKKARKSKKKNDDSADDEEEEDGDNTPNPVGEMLAQNTYLTDAKPNCKAQYYIFLKSASWCGPCNREMPEVVKAYQEMKKTGKVELILLSHDQTDDAAKGFLSKYNATFPCLMRSTSPKVPELPPNAGIPNATFVKADGTVIKSDHGVIIRDWKNLTIGKYAVIDDDGEPRVGAAIKKLKFTNGKPSAGAKFYMYYYYPDMSKATDSIMAKIAEEYKEMKKSGVDLIFITKADTLPEISKELKKYKVRFPAMMASDATKLPGMSVPDATTPQIYMVTKSGANITSGDASTIGNWKEAVDANR